MSKRLALFFSDFFLDQALSGGRLRASCSAQEIIRDAWEVDAGLSISTIIRVHPRNFLAVFSF
jgi:hypothetical protein